MSDDLPRLVVESLGGSPLARAAIGGARPEWYGTRPSTAREWNARSVEAVRGVDADWLSPLLPAFGASGAGLDRLMATHAAGGVVVTTGQQPGLFGGPMYTLSKALSALELANALERVTGIATAPVFWAATDDADFAEAEFVWTASASGAERLHLDQVPTEGIPMAEVPIEGVGGALERLARACGSGADSAVLRAVQQAYARPGATIGSAYLELMRGLLGPLGIAVIDASHPALLAAEMPVLRAALARCSDVHQALERREASLRDAGFEPQVAGGRELTLVFGREGGKKARLPMGTSAEGQALSPNVLLRPVAEAAVLPTVAYVAGPGELAYFAQVSAVADALHARQPLAVPRWSATLVDGHVEGMMTGFGMTWRDLEHAHDVERRIAVQHVPGDLMQHLARMRETLQEQAAAFKSAVAATDQSIDPRIVDGTSRALTWRVDRLERRVVAAAKRREAGLLRRVDVARGTLFPGGKRQERALSFIPHLATRGQPLLDAMRASAARHAEAVMSGGALPVDP